MKLKFAILLFLCFIVQYSNGQETNDSTDAVEVKIKEVYGDFYESLVINDPTRNQILRDLLQNRIEFIQEPISVDEKFEKLSQKPLFNKYNPNLERDTNFNKETFNVLKYNLSFFQNYDVVYRIDNTDWLILIHSKK